MRSLLILGMAFLLLACTKNSVTGDIVLENECVKGNEVLLPHPVSEATVPFIVQGFTQYDQKTMCKASHTDDKTGNNLKAEYYYSRTPRESIMLLVSENGMVLSTQRKTGQEAIEVN